MSHCIIFYKTSKTINDSNTYIPDSLTFRFNVASAFGKGLRKFSVHIIPGVNQETTDPVTFPFFTSQINEWDPVTFFTSETGRKWNRLHDNLYFYILLSALLNSRHTVSNRKRRVSQKSSGSKKLMRVKNLELCQKRVQKAV